MNEKRRGFVVAPLALFKVELEVDFNAVELSQATLGEAPEGFDPVDVGAAIGEGLLLVDPHMLVITDIDQPIVSRPTIGTEHALRIDPAPNNRPQSLLGAVRDDFGINFPRAFENTEDWLFAGAPAAPSGQRTASQSIRTKVTFVHFHHPLKLTALTHPLQDNEQSKAPIEAVDRLAIEPQKRRSLSRC